MNNKSINKYIFSFLLCSILASNSVSTRAEGINIEKINFELGVSCLKQNDYKQAIRYFELVVQKNPKNIEAYYNLALAYKKSGMAEKSVSEFDTVVKLLNDPKNSQVKEIDINKISQENRILHSNELASDKYGLYSKVKSQENDYIDLGDIHYDNQQFDTAIEYYNLALQINPYNDSIYFKIAKSYVDAGNFIKAKPYITKAVELTPQNPKFTYYKDLVEKNTGSKKINLPQKTVNQPINKKELFREETPAVKVSTEINKSKNNPDFQKEETKKIEIPNIKLNDKILKPKIVSEIKSPAYKNTFTEDKKQLINQENSSQGKSQELDYLDLADLHYDNQELETAIEYYTLALNINSNNDYTYYKLARCFLDMKQYKNADKYIDKAIAFNSVSSQKKYFYFKDEILNKLNSDNNTALSYKIPDNFTKSKTNKVVKLNPDLNKFSKERQNPSFNNLVSPLKMIAEDPKINPEDETVSTEKQDVSEVKSAEKPHVIKNQKLLEISAFFNKLKPDFSQFNNYYQEKIVVKVPQKEKVKEKISVKVDKSKTLITDISKQQTASTEMPASVFGNDMKYYQTQEPEHAKPAEIQYEKPMQEETKEVQYTADYYNEKGIEYFKRDNAQKAENFFKKALELNPMYAKAYNNLANIEVQKDNPEKAIEYSNKALAIEPSYPESFYNLALIYKKKKDFANEIAYLDKAIQADPKYYQAYFTKGLAYYNAGKYEQAKYNFKEVLNLKNDHYLASQNLGIIYANELNKTEAENYLKTAIRLNKDNPTSYYYLASIYQSTGSVFDAIENYRKTIELDPSNYKAYLALSKVYEQNDEVDRAIDTLNDAIQLNQSNAEPYNYKGLLYLKKDKYIEATNAFQKAIALNPNRSVYHYNLSQSYICLNMKNKAQMEFEKAVNNQPKSIQDVIDLSEIFYDRSMPSYSIKVLKEGIAILPDNDYLYVVLSNFYEKTGAINSAKKLLSDYLVKKPNGTLSLLIQRKLSSMENTGNNNEN
ncbi:MAG: tetratricopeptide repeat protein [bacterium]